MNITTVKILLFATLICLSYQDNHIISSTKMIPHTLKQATGGEDAYFVGRDILVVADGVGGILL